MSVEILLGYVMIWLIGVGLAIWSTKELNRVEAREALKEHAKS